MSKPIRYLRKAAVTLRDEGALSVSLKALQKVERDRNRKRHSGHKVKYASLVARDDVLAADWSTNPYVKDRTVKHHKPYTINWVMSPPSGGGGHQNIFRFIEYLDRQGHQNNVYIYSTMDNMPLAQARENVKAYCKAEHLTFQRYKGSMAAADVVFATGWETAYPVFNDPIDARKMYFIQDFEPYFYPIGTDYILAENTYRFGFYGITAGGFLDDKLRREYGMRADHYDFASEAGLYGFKNKAKRKEIFFYARPVTERRGFDLGIMALQLFHDAMPEYTINLAGWDVSEYDIPFPYVNHKAMQLSELPALYNQCAAALVISLTNMSLLPLELLACGTIPVVNDGPNNRLVSDNKNLVYTAANPRSLADALIKTVSAKNQTQHAEVAAKSVASASWEQSCEKFMKILDRELTNG